jgi:hypothetical protein
MLKKLIGVWLSLCVCAGCASAQNQPAAPASAPSTAAISPDSAVDDVLDALDRRGDELKDFSAVVTLADTDPTLGNETKLTGRMWMRRLGADDARLRVVFDRKEVNEKVTSERQEYTLAGGQLVERKYVDQTEVRRQVLQPGQKMNLLKLGEGPFPLPLGQDKADVHKMFEVKKLPPAADDPGGTVHVQLAPKKGTEFEMKFATIDFWVDLASTMPVRIVTMDPNGATQRTTELKDIKVNGGLGDADFAMPPIDERKWTIRSQAYED